MSERDARRFARGDATGAGSHLAESGEVASGLRLGMERETRYPATADGMIFLEVADESSRYWAHYCDTSKRAHYYIRASRMPVRAHC